MQQPVEQGVHTVGQPQAVAARRGDGQQPGDAVGKRRPLMDNGQGQVGPLQRQSGGETRNFGGQGEKAAEVVAVQVGDQGGCGSGIVDLRPDGGVGERLGGAAGFGLPAVAAAVHNEALPPALQHAAVPKEHPLYHQLHIRRLLCDQHTTSAGKRQGPDACS